MEIGRKDVIWNFAATFMRVASGLIVLPIVLRLLSREEYALWTVFLTVGSMVTLLDFGFSNSFSRNITYIFSGVKSLKATGYDAVDQNDTSIDYGLLKSVIRAMRKYYGILAIGFLFLFVAISPFYLSRLLVDYPFDKQEIWIAWFIYGVLVAYQLYTYYYGSILMGRGYVKKYQQIVIVGQSIRIITIVILLLSGLGIISLVVGQLVGDIVNRSLCYRGFYDKDIKAKIKNSALAININETMKTMTPNAIKIGITTLGGFLVNKAVVFIASIYLTLPEIGSYGVTKQMIDLISSLGFLWFNTYYPKITLHRVSENLDEVKRMYIKGKIALIGVFAVCGLGLVFVGPPLLVIIHSKTALLSSSMTFLFLIVAFLETNHAFSAQLLLTKNEVPFAKASILSGIGVVILLYAGFHLTHWGVWIMILAPGLSQAAYQNWKWPLEVIKDLKIQKKDYSSGIINIIKKNK